MILGGKGGGYRNDILFVRKLSSVHTYPRTSPVKSWVAKYVPLSRENELSPTLKNGRCGVFLLVRALYGGHSIYIFLP